jgi:hypothetical protein
VENREVREKNLECEKEMMNVMEMENVHVRETKRRFSLYAVRMTEYDCDSHLTNFDHGVPFFQNQTKWKNE